jgi:hypothetical protein
MSLLGELLFAPGGAERGLDLEEVSAEQGAS